MEETATRAPDAVFLLSTAAGKKLSADAHAQLRAVLDTLGGQKNTFFVLEAWLPEAGSREVGIGQARQAANSLRDALIAMGVRSYRIRVRVRGERGSQQAQFLPDVRRVDLYLSPLPR